MSVGAYYRVSSRGQNFELQYGAVGKDAKARGLVIDEVYKEKRSATVLQRPELDRLRADVRSGRVQTVLVFKIDRLTRTGVQDTFTLVSEILGAGATLIAVADNLKLTPGANDIVTDVMLFALGLAAKIENTSRRERIAAARERAEAAGKRWGRPSRVDPELASKALALRAEGRSVRAIAIALKTPKTTVARALASRNPAPENLPESVE